MFDVPLQNLILAIALAPVFIAPAVAGVWWRAKMAGKRALITIFEISCMAIWGIVLVCQATLCKAGHGDAIMHEIHADMFASIFTIQCIIVIIVIFYVLLAKLPRS
jgi:hypothetical protein